MVKTFMYKKNPFSLLSFIFFFRLPVQGNLREFCTNKTHCIFSNRKITPSKNFIWGLGHDLAARSKVLEIELEPLSWLGGDLSKSPLIGSGL